MKIHIAMLLIAISLVLTACGNDSSSSKERRDLPFTVIPASELPDNLKTILDERKEHPFQITYATTDALYIAEGYGSQPTGGYTIQVVTCQEDGSSIFFESCLTGPSEQDIVSNRASFPIIVIKVPFMDYPVTFE